jgi:hypothetical protein
LSTWNDSAADSSAGDSSEARRGGLSSCVAKCAEIHADEVFYRPDLIGVHSFILSGTPDILD